MKSKRTPAALITVVSLAVSVLAILGVRAVTAQDTGQAKYNVRVPNGLAFSSSKDTKPGRSSPSVTTTR
jgi:hypothetical protein